LLRRGATRGTRSRSIAGSRSVDAGHEVRSTFAVRRWAPGGADRPCRVSMAVRQRATAARSCRPVARRTRARHDMDVRHPGRVMTRWPACAKTPRN
jgi:hypothetical protein